MSGISASLGRIITWMGRYSIICSISLVSIALIGLWCQPEVAWADTPTPRAFLPLIFNRPDILGKVYYVATDGSDSNPGTEDQPWETIQHAAGRLQAGEGVLIRGGTYTVTVSISPKYSGNPNNGYITFKAYPGKDEPPVVLQGDGSTYDGIFLGGDSYIIIEGLTIRGFYQGIACQAPGHHIIIRNNIVEYNLKSGISSAGHVEGTKNACDYLTIEGNVVHHNGYYEDGAPATGPGEGTGSGININPGGNPYVFDTDYSHFHSVIRGNRVYHNIDGTGDHLEGHGIIIDRGGNLPPFLIENNVVFDNGGKGIHLYGAQNVWIVGNTLYKNCTDWDSISLQTQAEIAVYDVKLPSHLPTKNIHVLNNIACSNDPFQITYFTSEDPYKLTMKNNLWCGNPYRETYSPYGTDYIRRLNPEDVKFVNRSSDPAIADFHLQEDSPAIDQGTNSLEPGSQLVDFDGTTRPQEQGYDMGAYEYKPD